MAQRLSNPVFNPWHTHTHPERKKNPGQVWVLKNREGILVLAKVGSRTWLSSHLKQWHQSNSLMTDFNNCVSVIKVTERNLTHIQQNLSTNKRLIKKITHAKKLFSTNDLGEQKAIERQRSESNNFPPESGEKNFSKHRSRGDAWDLWSSPFPFCKSHLPPFPCDSHCQWGFSLPEKN